MIDPVNNRGYYEYSKINTNIENQLENGEKFSLDYEKKDESDEKAKVLKDKGVVVELSENGPQRESMSNQEKQPDSGEEITLEQTVTSVRKLFLGVADFFSQLFKKVGATLLAFWNSDSAQAEELPQENEMQMDSTQTEELPQENGTQTNLTEDAAVEQTEDISHKSLEEIQAYLESGTKHYVKNSDLLTYYDRSGKFVQLNGADKERILKGEQERYGKM